MGIDYLRRSVDELVNEYNEFCKIDSSNYAQIDPQIIGVVFTMVQVTSGQPISAQRPYISQTQALGVPVFDTHLRENKTLYADSPQYGVPVVLANHSSSETNKRVISEIKSFATEFLSKV